MKLQTAVFLILTLASTSLFAEGAAGPDVELVCPCTYESASSSSAIANFGVINRGNSTSGELILRTYAHTETNYAVAVSKQFLGDIALTNGLPSESTIPLASYQARLNQPDSGSYYITFLLLEDNTIIDMTRMKERVTFGKVASSAFSDLYFVSDPTFSVSGSTLTLNLPGIGNSGSSDESVEVLIAATEAEDFFAGPFTTLAEYTAISSVPAGTRTSADIAALDYTSPPAGFDFHHIVVSGGGFTLLLHTVEAPGVTYESQSFDVTSVDYLTDSDGDGVADDNEFLAGTNPSVAASTPGASYIDILAVYSEAVTAFYNGDPSARLDHLITVSNQALADSNVDIVLRLAASEELAMDTNQSIGQWLAAAEANEGVFSNLQSLRDDTGADLITMFRRSDGGDTCGLATLGGFATQGLMERSSHISANFIEFDECNDLTMIHEVGHNMGLGHSAKQNETGTFTWSRGYGLDNRFATLMAYSSAFNLFSELPYFSNPDVVLCDGSACGIDIDQATPSHAAKSLNAVRFQVAEFTASGTVDSDSDGVVDSEDAFANNASESVDTDADGIGNNADYDDDNDGMPDFYEMAQGHDALVNDASEDDDNDGMTNLEEYEALPRATQYLQTTSAGANVTRLHIVNTSAQSQAFRGTLFSGTGEQLGDADQSLGANVAPDGRLILASEDMESIFGVDAWKGPAMLEVSGTGSFELMAKLVSPSGLVSNTNCVRTDRVLNIEGFDSDNMTFVRLINTSDNRIDSITGTLYDSDGEVVGSANTELVPALFPKQQVWVNRNNLASLVGAEWEGEAMLEVTADSGLRLLNLNFVNAETFFNFSCFESSPEARIYLQTTSASGNVSSTHLVNTSDTAQQFTGTLYNGAGEQQGSSGEALHEGTIPPKGRVVLSSESLETVFGVPAWSGPAVLDVTGAESFELMTKLRSPSGLISNTNCVRQNEVHNIEGADSPDMTFIRFINTGDSTLSNITGTLRDAAGDAIGPINQVLVDSLAPRQQVWRNRNHLTDIFGESWNGEALLSVDGDNDLRLLNLNYINSETFFNFSCYERSGSP